MKSVRVIAAIGLFLLSFGGNAEDGQASGQNAAPLFLHLIMPHLSGGENESPSHRVLTTPVKLSEVFAASTEDHLNRVTGRIELQDGKYLGRIEESSSGGSGFFNGEIMLHKPFSIQGGGFASGMIVMRFVLSTNSNAAAFVEDPNYHPPKANNPRFPFLSATFPEGLYGIDFQNDGQKQTLML